MSRRLLACGSRLALIGLCPAPVGAEHGPGEAVERRHSRIEVVVAGDPDVDVHRVQHRQNGGAAVVRALKGPLERVAGVDQQEIGGVGAFPLRQHAQAVQPAEPRVAVGESEERHLLRRQPECREQQRQKERETGFFCDFSQFPLDYPR